MERGELESFKTGEVVYGSDEPILAFIGWDRVADKLRIAKTTVVTKPPPITPEQAHTTLLSAVNRMLAHSLHDKGRVVESKCGGSGLDRCESALAEFDAQHRGLMTPDWESINTVRAMVGDHTPNFF